MADAYAEVGHVGYPGGSEADGSGVWCAAYAAWAPVGSVAVASGYESGGYSGGGRS